jgi:hypothetical protein
MFFSRIFETELLVLLFVDALFERVCQEGNLLTVRSSK